MSLSASASREFSASLLRIHAAADVTSLESACRNAEVAHADAGWLVELVREHARQRRDQLQARTAPAHAGLTAREHQVLQRIALGETDAVIGRALGIAARTVSKHMENILRKLGVETRTAAALQARSRA
jgi:DNA-binding NarL/FixJ family response regulator